MKIILSVILCFCCVVGFAEDAHISGNNSVAAGATETYTVAFESWNSTYANYANVNWTVSGGTIISHDKYSATIQWNSTGGFYGSIHVEEDLVGQFGNYQVGIQGDPVPTIYPLTQLLNYGDTPNYVTVSFGYPPTTVTYQWQQWSGAGQTWVNLPGETSLFFQPPTATNERQYRCVVAVNGNVTHLLASALSIRPFDPGILTLNGIPAYNAAVSLAATDASGGYCPASAYSYLWEVSKDYGPWTVAGTSAVAPSVSITGNVRVRRKVSCASAELYSNTLSVDPAYTTVDFENLNYVRETTVAKKGVRSWQEADQLPIGDKFQTTTYTDGLERPVQSVEKGVSSTQNTVWNDLVKHYAYDPAGNTPKDFLPYSSASNPGKFKDNAGNEQAAFVQSFYGEPSTAPTYALTETDGSPLNRVTKQTLPGQGWIGSGTSYDVDFNKASEKVHVWNLDYTTGAVPTTSPTQVYAEGALLKNLASEVKNATTGETVKVITYTDRTGQMILKKVQHKDAGSGLMAEHAGWICTYYVYDDLGRLAYELQPEAVKYLDEHNWSFAGTEGQSVLDELCFQYRYDEKGRNTWKKAPGAEPLLMLYDVRDRLVFTQDGNQRNKTTPEWTATLYDELDRPVITTLYQPGKPAGDLQTDLDNALSGTVTVTNGGQAVNNLVVADRNLTPPPYKARQTIEFVNEFSSNTGDEFTAEIDPAAATPTTVVSALVYKDPVSNADLNNPAVCTVLKYQFYDNYAFTGAKPFDAAFDNAAAYPAATPNLQPIAATARTTGFATGSLVRVLGTATFLASTSYYDERGAQIQSTEDNFKGGSDVVTIQYGFDGRVYSSHSKHATAGTGYTGFGILTKNSFDKIGRITGTEKRFDGNSGFKPIAAYTYDEMGKLKTKQLSPGYNNNSGLELLNYSYNIQGQLTGVNKDYALKTGAYDKWGHFFGYYLGFDNRDGLFHSANLNGKVTGQLWNTQGDDAQRRYDYSYDNAGRLVKADFTQKENTAGGWENSKMDFSVKGDGPGETVRYDLNGNLQSMIQRGFVLTMNGPANVDNLQYEYKNNGLSNRLRKVTDGAGAALGANNGKAGDFKDGDNGDRDDYDYDADGNLVYDLNKGAATGTATAPLPGITYNFLDKPEEITVAGKGVIKFVYDADGTKLQKIFTPLNTTTPVVTAYVNGYVYKGDDLQYIGFEEGRIRVVQPVDQGDDKDLVRINGNLALPGGKQGTLDYYLRDYQQNVRMILTEETHVGYNTCTMEDARKVGEQAMFGQADPANPTNTNYANNEVYATRFHTIDIPGQDIGQGWSNNSNLGSEVSRLGALAAKKIGPNVLLKVMAGDKIKALTDYYYKTPVTNGTGDNLTSAVLGALVNAITGSAFTGSVAHGAGSTLSANLNAPDNPIPFTTAPDAANAQGTSPKAYLTVLFFDERFRYVAENSTAVRVGAAGGSSLLLPDTKAPKNGYCYVYLSNESNEPVYFDNFKVQHERGRIVEEDHYYAYGLKIQALSSQKAGDAAEGHLDNKNLYNAKELIDEADLGWYDYGFRSYDPQIGRFPQLDPLTFEYPYLTPYQYASCDPATNIDVDGLEGMPAGFGNAYFGQLTQYIQDSYPVGMMSEVTITNSLHFFNGRGLRLSIPQLVDQVCLQCPRFTAPPNSIFQQGVNLNSITNSNQTTVHQRDMSVMAQMATQETEDFYAGQNARARATMDPIAGDITWNSLTMGKNVIQAPLIHGYEAGHSFGEGEYWRAAGYGILLAIDLSPLKGEGAIAEGIVAEGKTIGLGIKADLAFHRGTGAITYERAGWQQAGLTRVDWGRASIDNYYFRESFKDAAKNARAIKFNVTGFDPNYVKPGMTSFEFSHVITNPSLLQKTTFIKDGVQVLWDGTKFVQ